MASRPSTRPASPPSESSPLLGRPPPSPPPPPSPSDFQWILLGVWSAVFLGAFDSTVVATLLTPIGNQFSATDKASYVGTAYLLSMCCFTPLYGRLSEIVGRKYAMLIALWFFGSGTILCGLAPSMPALLAARAVSGIGGGGVMTVASVVVSDLVPLNKRGLYQGGANVLYGLGAALGGPVGGWINDSFGWRNAFYMQTPVFLFSFVVVSTKVDIPLSPEIQRMSWPRRLLRIDVLGSFTLVTTVGSFLLALSVQTSEQLRWTHPLVCGFLVVSGVSAVLFVWVEKHWAECPVMPLGMLSRRTPLAVSLANLLTSMAAFSALYNAPIFSSAVRLESATTSGARLLPHSLAIPAGSLFAGWCIRKTGKLYSLTFVSASITILASALLVSWDTRTPTYRLWADLVPHGFGIASILTTTLIAIIATVSKEDMPVAIGITYLFRTTGQVLGVSLSGTLLQDVLLRQLKLRIHGPGSSQVIDAIRRDTDIIKTLDPERQLSAVESYGDALRAVFVCQVAVNVLVLAACMAIQEKSLIPPSSEHRNQRQRNEDDSDNRGLEPDA